MRIYWWIEPENLLSLRSIVWRFLNLFSCEIWPERILCLGISILNFIGICGKFPLRWLLLRSKVFSFHNPERSGILPVNSLFDNLRRVRVQKFKMVLGVEPDSLLCDTSTISSLLRLSIPGGKPPVKKLSGSSSLVNSFRLETMVGIGPQNLFFPRLSWVSAVRFPTAGVRNPSYPPESRSIPNTRLVELSEGIVHVIPRKFSPGLSQGST